VVITNIFVKRHVTVELRSWKKFEEDKTTEDDVKTCNNYHSENGEQRKNFEIAKGKYLIYRRKKIRNTVCFSSETMRWEGSGIILSGTERK
jgi:hypothetical protein